MDTKSSNRRQSDNLVYTFVRKISRDGNIAYQRQDQDLWITNLLEWGWVACDDASQSCMGRPWNMLPKEQESYPPEAQAPYRFMVYTMVVCALLVGVGWLKGEPPRSRWGND